MLWHQSHPVLTAEETASLISNGTIEPKASYGLPDSSERTEPGPFIFRGNYNETTGDSA